MKTKLLIIFALAISLAFFGCKNRTNHPKNDKPVARVYNKYLYLSDLEKAIPNNIPPEDSAIQAERFINNWIINQLMEKLAQQYLKDEQKNIDKKVEEFRHSLMIYLLKQKLIKQKLDTNVSPDEIAQYYQLHKNEFLLTQPAILGYFIRVPRSSQYLSKIKQLAFSNQYADFEQLQQLVEKAGGQFIDFRSTWTYFNNIIQQIPVVVNNSDQYLKTHKYIVAQDNNYFYFLRITDYKLTGEEAPLNLYQDHIKRIILNDRAQKLIQKLEQTIYNQAIENGNIKIFQ